MGPEPCNGLRGIRCRHRAGAHARPARSVARAADARTGRASEDRSRWARGEPRLRTPRGNLRRSNRSRSRLWIRQTLRRELYSARSAGGTSHSWPSAAGGPEPKIVSGPRPGAALRRPRCAAQRRSPRSANARARERKPRRDDRRHPEWSLNCARAQGSPGSGSSADRRRDSRGGPNRPGSRITTRAFFPHIMKTRFAFGKHGIEVSVPGNFDCRIVTSRTATALPDASAALDAALDSPIGSEPLAKLALGKRTAAISVCDITRPAPNRVTLPPLLKRLHAAGIQKDGIVILIATGLHRAATKEELDVILGPEIAATYNVASHDARDFAAHRSLGTTRRGTPVYIDERFMAADLHLSLGFVEPHLMLGFSGGRKLVVPGQAAHETIKVVHSPRFNREPLATEGSIEGNPLHQEFLEIAAMARHDFILDVTLTRDREISGVFAGNPIKAHAAAVRFFESTSLESLDGLRSEER